MDRCSIPVNPPVNADDGFHRHGRNASSEADLAHLLLQQRDHADVHLRLAETGVFFLDLVEHRSDFSARLCLPRLVYGHRRQDINARATKTERWPGHADNRVWNVVRTAEVPLPHAASRKDHLGAPG